MKAFISIALGCTALIVASPALAKPGNGHGNAYGRGGVSSDMRGGLDGLLGLDARSQARLNSRGPAHASDRALEPANEHSVLHGTTRYERTTSGRRLRSRGPIHASATARARANRHSVIAGTTTVETRGTRTRTRTRTHR